MIWQDETLICARMPDKQRSNRMEHRARENRRNLRVFAAVTCLSAACSLPVQGETMDSRIGKLEFEAGYPAEETVQKL